MDEKGMEEQDVYPVGVHTAWSTPDGMTSEVRNGLGRVLHSYSGETSWSDASRVAGDLNTRMKSGI